MTTLPSEPRSVIEPVNVELLLRSFTLKLPQKVGPHGPALDRLGPSLHRVEDFCFSCSRSS